MATARPRRILYLIGQLGVGGTERQLLYLVQKMDRGLFEPQCACLNDDVPLLPLFEGLCPVHVLKGNDASRWAALQRLRGICDQFQPDIVHCFGYSTRAAIAGLSVPFRAGRVFSVRGLPRWHTAWDKWFDMLAWRRADLVLSNSRSVLNAYAAALGPRQRCTRAIPNGLDLDEFDLAYQGEAALLDDAAADLQGKQVICVVARLCVEKRLDVLIAAIASLAPVCPGIALWIVGSGPLRDELVEQVRRLGLGTVVVFWGNRSDVPALLRHASVGVLSSEFEGMPNALMEYMAARLPVVATDVGGNSELVLHGETGLLVPPGDATALAQALFMILHNSDLARRFGEAGRRRVEIHFTVGRMVGDTLSAYLDLVSHGR